REMSAPVYYGAESVRRVLSWRLVNEAVEEALKAVAAQSPSPSSSPSSYVVSQPQRSVTMAGGDRSQLLLTMPAYVGNYRLAGTTDERRRSTLACKLVTSFGHNGELQPPLASIAAHILLFNVRTGELDAIMCGTDITTWRTASASVVATKHLYFARVDVELAINVAIVGCGTQGEIHAVAMCCNFRVQQLLLFNRTASRAHQLAAKLRRMAVDHPPHIVVCSSASEAVRNANVVCVATNSKEPLFNASDLGPARRPIHINAVGAGEVHFGEVANDVYARSEVFVDSLASAEHELRGFPVPIAGEVGGVIESGYKPATLSTTIFQSMG
ncbi:hypothetical protein KR044_009142, partial [Drosophila immigrans]